MKYFKLYFIAFLLVCGLLIYVGWWFLLGVVIFLGVVYGFITLLAFGVEAGFRSKYPMDFLIHTNWLNNYFYIRGFDIVEYDIDNPDYPQTILRKDNETILVRLNAPLMSSSYSYSILKQGDSIINLKFPISENREKIVDELNRHFAKYPIVRDEIHDMKFFEGKSFQ